MSTLLLSAWGASASWANVNYRLEVDGAVVSKRSRTSLATLWEYASRGGEEEEKRVLVIALESLLAPSDPGKRPWRMLEESTPSFAR